MARSRLTVDDQELVAGHLLLQAQEPAFVAGLHQFVHEGGGGGEADGEALLAGGQAESESNVGLSRAARAEGDDVLPSLDPLAAGQLEHLHLVEAGDRLEVEAVEAFDSGKPRGLDAALDHPALAVDQLEFHQPGEELHMVLPLGGALAGELAVLSKEGRQLQRLEMMVEQQLRRVAHAEPPAIRHI